MSTVKSLDRYFHSKYDERTRRIARQREMRAAWADALATLAIVALASTIVFEILRLLSR